MSEARIWDRFAANYDRTVRHFDRSYDRIRELIRADLAGRSRILEVASGTGQFTFALAGAADQLIATDVSAAMIRQLDGKLAGRGAENVTTAVMSAYQLAVAGGSQDAIFCANALHVMEHPERALADIHRALRPGGRLIVPTFCHGIDRRRRLLSWLLGLVSPFVAHTRFTPASLAAMVRSAGFDPGEPTVLPGKFPIAYLVADKPNA
jgi:ubiquinone/menaquinone biosynthesis C-methylase UbiE